VISSSRFFNISRSGKTVDFGRTGGLGTVGFIGGGQMATALASGIISSGFTIAENVVAGDVTEFSRNAFIKATGAKAVIHNEEAVKNRDIVILAVKPQVMKQVLTELRGMIKENQLIVSIVAGFNINAILENLSEKDKPREDIRIIRVMPNTPALIGKGAAAYSLGGKATQEDGKTVERLCKGVGTAVEVPERLLDAVTGLSGSGPAYVYQFIEALSDGGVSVGLPRDIATQLAAQTVFGAAGMVLETGEHPACLRDRVTSPGGTTIAGLHALERGAIRATIIDGVKAATARATELGTL